MGMIEKMIIDTPWLLTEEYIKIIDTYEAEIVGIEKDYYMIEFRDSEMEVMEMLLPVNKFSHHFMHPVKVEEGYAFYLVKYQILCNKEITISAWPPAQYWYVGLKRNPIWE